MRTPRGIWVNRADSSEILAGDFITPAKFSKRADYGDGFSGKRSLNIPRARRN